MFTPERAIRIRNPDEQLASASKHKALSWEHANRSEAQLREEVQQLLKLAEDSDSRPVNDGLDVLAESARRDKRLAMPTPRGGFEQSYNAPAAVDTQTMLVVALHISQAPNDKREVAPILAKNVPMLAVKRESHRGEWSLVTMAWNRKRLHVLRVA